MKTSELIGSALDWAVAKCEGAYPQISYPDKRLFGAIGDTFDYSTDWSQGGPIIEREKIFIIQPYRSLTYCKAYKMENDSDLPCWLEDGHTPLIAAMRCYVASKLGDEVELPEELQ